MARPRVLCGDAGVPVLNTAGGVCFLGLVRDGGPRRARGAHGRSRATTAAAVVRFIAYAVAASFAAGLTQRDLWPFAKWPMAGGRADAVAAQHAHRGRGRRRRRARRRLPRLAAARPSTSSCPWMHRTFDAPAAGRAGAGRPPTCCGWRSRAVRARRAGRGPGLLRPLSWARSPRPTSICTRGCGARAAETPAAALRGACACTARAGTRRSAASIPRACERRSPSSTAAVTAACARRGTRFWFAPEPAVNLAAARIVFALQALWILLSRDMPALSALPPRVLDRCPGVRALAVPHLGRPSRARVGRAGGRARWPWRARCWESGRVPCCAAAGLLLYHLAPLETLFYTPSPWAKGLTLPVLG